MIADSLLPPHLETPEHRAARRWLTLSLAVLVFAGLFALAVVIGRTPPLDRFVTDPLFFKRCLVAHVNLALVTWFYSFLMALLFLVPSSRRAGPVARHGVELAAVGIALMLVGAVVPTGSPLLANYIPTIDNPWFMLGQIVFACGLFTGLATRRTWAVGDRPTGVVTDLPAGQLSFPPAARAGLRALAFALVLTAGTLVASGVTQTPGLPFDVRYDFLVWGAGHSLQLVSVIGMVTVWIVLLTPVLGAPPISGPAASALFLSLVLPWTMGPLFALAGTESLAYRHGFTHLMRWCLFPVVGVFLLLCCGAVARAWRVGRISPATLRDSRLSAFFVSAALTLLGFVLGAAIRDSSTMVPAHYHAAVGGVTVAFMVLTYVLLPAFNIAIPGGWPTRAATWQPVIYGLGMFIFAGGFALAGAHGMGRKIYGAEQSARGAAETIGLALMGAGGLVAITGGILFLVIVCRSCWSAAGAVSRGKSEQYITPVEPGAPAAARPLALAGRPWRSPR
ncbi:MAG: cbb3-type cytochrome c oxidase subunit I [Candidatus Eisenbacteria bacterium]